MVSFAALRITKKWGIANGEWREVKGIRVFFAFLLYDQPCRRLHQPGFYPGKDL